MFDKILGISVLARKAEVDEDKSVCVCPGQRLETCSSNALELPTRPAKVFDVTAGKMQEMHIDTEDGCSTLYHRFSSGVCGYIWRNAEELKEWVDTDC